MEVPTPSEAQSSPFEEHLLERVAPQPWPYQHPRPASRHDRPRRRGAGAQGQARELGLPDVASRGGARAPGPRCNPLGECGLEGSR
jgi:hypothetical protein